jgi:RHS repeat-associated protein
VFNRFRLDLSTSGSTLTIKVYYNGAYKFTATDGSPFAAGSVGMIGGYNLAYWDNVVAMTNVSPATVVSYDDYDGWGMILEGRSAVNGDGRPRFKFTGKERDTESKYDYFGARLYDGRIARFMQMDPQLTRYPNLTPFCYVANNPLGFVDPTGMDSSASSSARRKSGLEVVLPIVLPILPVLAPALPGVLIDAGAFVGALAILTVATTSQANEGEKKVEKPTETQQIEGAEKPAYPVPALDEHGKPKTDDWIAPKSAEGNYNKPKPSREYLRPDPDHKPPLGPHTDWRDPSGKTWRIFPDGRVEPKFPGQTR